MSYNPSVGLADNSVTTNKLADGNVTSIKLGGDVTAHGKSLIKAVDAAAVRNLLGASADNGEGLATALPPAGIVGRLYHETDTGLIKRDTGSAWTAWAVLQHGHAAASSEGQILHANIAGTGPNDHHNQQHSIWGNDHSGWTAVSQLPVGASGIIRKPVDTARSSSTSLTADPHLNLAVAANTIYWLEYWLLWTGSNATHDGKLQVTGPAGTAVAFGFSGASTQSSFQVVAPGSIPSLLSSGALSFGAGVGQFGVCLIGQVSVGATVGIINLQWAQNSSDPNPLTLNANSYVRVTRLL